MRRTNLGPVILTFLMLLLVLTSAVVFLWNRNRELDRETRNLSEFSDVILVTRSQLESDLAVLDSAYESAGATIEASNSERVSAEATLQAYISQVPQAESSPTVGEVTAVDPEPQLVIFGPSDGAVVRPLETMTLYLAALDRSGIDGIEVVINEDQPLFYPAGGLVTFTLPIRWEVPGEGTYTIRARAVGSDGQSSQTETIIIEASYQSDEDRSAALDEVQFAELSSLRFPEAALESLTTSIDAGGENSLHLQMLMGWDAFDPLSVYSRTIALQVFDFLPSGYDLGDYQQQIESVILAYINPEFGVPISVDVIDGEDPFSRWSGAHEMAHRIQDESFQLELVDFTAFDSDARSSFRALVEGEAAFLQYLYLTGDAFTDEERVSVESALESRRVSVLDTLPMFLRQDFEFGYTEGFQFIQHIFDKGGFQALDAIWRNPPQSTEQILHPERYIAGDAPQHPYLPDLQELLESDWRVVFEDSFGEFYLREYLAQTLSPEQASAAAAGWEGGSYAVYEDQANSARLLVLRLAWDTATELAEFDTAFRDFTDHRTGSESFQPLADGTCWADDETICFYQVSGDTLIIHSPDLATAELIASSIIVP